MSASGARHGSDGRSGLAPAEESPSPRAHDGHLLRRRRIAAVFHSCAASASAVVGPIESAGVAVRQRGRIGARVLVLACLEDAVGQAQYVQGESNARQVRQVRQIIEGLGLEVASPDDAREILQLKGKDRVAF